MMFSPLWLYIKSSLSVVSVKVFYVIDGRHRVHVFVCQCTCAAGSSLPPPVLSVFPPSSAELQSSTSTLVCVAVLPGASKGLADVTWLGVSSGITTSGAVQQPDQTFQISSYLSIKTAQWLNEKVYTCQVSLGSQTSQRDVSVSDCDIK